MPRLRVAAFGLGPIGQRAAALVMERDATLKLVGAVDIDPTLVGRDVGDVLGRREPIGVGVEPDAEAVFARERPDVVLHCTSSFVPDVRDQIQVACHAGANVVSSCEELLFAEHQHPDDARDIDAVAKAEGVTVLGTGINPGYLLDYLPVVLSGACRRVDRVRGLRVVDAATRRGPLQRKVGAGLSLDAFAARAAAGRLGHIGMLESVALVGRTLGLDLDEVVQTLEPVVADRDLETEHVTVKAGHAAGIKNVGRGRGRGETLVELDLRMFVGAADPRDEIWLEGDPDLHLHLVGGTPGDEGTAAVLVNSVPRVVAAEPGLVTVVDLPPAHVG